MRAVCVAQGKLLNGLWLPEREGNPRKRAYVCVYLIHLVQQKLAQYDKATTLQRNKLNSREPHLVFLVLNFPR